MRRTSVALIIVLGLALLTAVVLNQPRGRDLESHEYDSYQAAGSGGYFADGWLPKVIPASATKIVTINDLDSHKSRGEFRYDPTESSAFLTRLRPRRDGRSLPRDFEARLPGMEAAGYRIYEYRQGGTVWLFFVNRKDGHVLYDMGDE
jgi:hypothetical protein